MTTEATIEYRAYKTTEAERRGYTNPANNQWGIKEYMDGNYSATEGFACATKAEATARAAEMTADHAAGLNPLTGAARG